MTFAREATEADARFLAPRLREADTNEIRAALGMEPLPAILNALAFSRLKAVAQAPDGEAFAIGGVVQHPQPNVGVVWLVATPAVERHRFLFLRQSRPFIEHLLTCWPVLTNAVDERNTTHIEWLKWLGFQFTQRIPAYGHEGRPFLEFVQCANP